MQRDIYESLAGGSHSSVLANLAAALDGEGARLTNYDKEVRQRKWYLQAAHPTQALALAPALAVAPALAPALAPTPALAPAPAPAPALTLTLTPNP